MAEGKQMTKAWQRLAAAIALGTATMSMAATPDQPPRQDTADEALAPQIWRLDGGDLRMRFNDSFLDLFGIGIKLSAGVRDPRNSEYAIFPVLASGGMTLNAPDGGFERFVDGQLKIRGGFELILPDASRVDLRDPLIRPSAANPLQLELVGADGQVWVYINHLMYEFVQDFRTFQVVSSDLRATPALAKRVGNEALADAYIGELHLDARVVERSREMTARPKGNTPNFHGTPHPQGGIYEADVLMETYSMSFSRCRRENGTNGCDGAGADNGEVVFTPSATLRNGNTDRTADVPWYRKFTTSPYSYPYPGNDQHPYLIWNMYRIVDDQLEQIGASGIKHAFLTINVGCAPGGSQWGGNILGRNCGDTYGTGNNDSNSDLGPRIELLPASGVWGRCGSVYDPNCVGSNTNPSPNTNYGSRLVVRESQMQVPGATYWSEAWYIVQDDTNIYNTMGRRPMAPAPGSNVWIPGNQGAVMQLGPVINAWVDPVANPTRNIEISTDQGRVRVAVKVKTLPACPAESGLSGTCYRYDYAVNNFDFANSATQGTLPNLRVFGAKGFDRFSIARPIGAGIHFPVDAHFADLDINPANNWTASLGGSQITWTAPAGNELNWGTLYRFSLISDAAPQTQAETVIELRPANPLPRGDLIGSIIGPTGMGARVMYDGFEGP